MNKGIELYTINKNVKCIRCGSKGAIKHYGWWYPEGLGEETGGLQCLEEYKNKEIMSYTMGFGGTMPHECLNCGNVGLVDIEGLEGFRKAFETIKEEQDEDIV